MPEAQVIKFERKSKRKPTAMEHALGVMIVASLATVALIGGPKTYNAVRESAPAAKSVLKDVLTRNVVTYEVPANNEPYREVEIRATTTGPYYNSIGAILDGVGEKSKFLDGDHYAALRDMLKKQNVQAQEAKGLSKEEINPILVHPGDTFRLPAEFENIGKLVTPENHNIG